MKMCLMCGSAERAVNSYCLPCNRKYQQDWYERNKQSRTASAARYYQKVKEERARRYQENRNAHSDAGKKRYALDPKIFIERAARNRLRRKSEDPEAYRAKEAEYRRKRRAESEKEVIHNRISCGVRDSLKRNGGGKRGRSVLDLLGFSVDQLADRLKSTLPSGYSWEDVISGGLHIDHIVPVAAFNFTSPDDPDFKRCWALSNLRLLPALDNIRKGARLEYPFQPSLSFGELSPLLQAEAARPN